MPYGQTNPNGLKVQPSLKMGTPELTWIYISVDDGGEGNTWNVEGEYQDGDSNFSRAINAIQRYCDVYAIAQPDATTFAVQVRADSVPLTGEEILNSDDLISVLTAAIAEKVDFGVAAVARSLTLTPPTPVIYIGTNSYITFGQGDDEYDDLDADTPPLPKIAVSADDNSMQVLYYGVQGTAPNRTYVAVYLGDSSTGDEGFDGDMKIEWQFFEATPHIIDIHIIQNGRTTTNQIEAFASATYTSSTGVIAIQTPSQPLRDAVQSMTQIAAYDAASLSGYTDFISTSSIVNSVYDSQTQVLTITLAPQATDFTVKMLRIDGNPPYYVETGSVLEYTDEGFTGVYSADALVASFPTAPAPGTAFRWNNQTQQVTAITYAPIGDESLDFFDLDAEPEGNEPPYEDWSEDDGYLSLPIPWTIPFLGVNYTYNN